DEEREAGRAVRHLRVDDAEGLDREEPVEVELERTRVPPALAIQPKKAPALESAGVERQPHAVGRHEGDVEVRGAEISRLKSDPRAQADVLDHRFERSELELDHGARVDVEAVAGG